MKALYLECNMGAAGDMLMAALLELHPNPKEFLEKLNNLGIPSVKIEKEASVKCGITGTHVKVMINGEEEESIDSPLDAHHHEHHDHDGHDHHHEHDHHDNHGHHHEHDHHEHHHDHHHTHGSMSTISHMIGHLNLSSKVKEDVLAIYQHIAQAESTVHGVSVDEIHFHEVGNMDAVADIVGVCMLIEALQPEQIIASPIQVGSGQVRCAHGILPVPAPATAIILKDIPIYSGTIRGELCTPTGAAILKHFVHTFGTMPIMKIQAIGYGMGKKNFEAANCVRAYMGYTEEKEEEIVELCCNLDDMTPEAIGFAQNLLLEKGALDVYTTPIGMKKNRPSILFSCMCEKEKREEMLSLVFKHTSTLGIREYSCKRYTLKREARRIETPYGSVRIKEASGWGIAKSKVEYEDLVKIATENNLSLKEVSEQIK